MAFKDPRQVKAYAKAYAKKHRARYAVMERERTRAEQIKEAGYEPPEHCELCGERAGETRSTKLHFDHDHKTGKFRGWLCAKCNTALGLFKDSPELLRCAAIYLQRHS